MDKSTLKWMNVFIIALVFMSFFALKSTFQYSTMSMIIPVIALLMMPIGEWLDRHFVVYKRITAVFIIVFALSLPIQIDNNGLTEAVISLFIFVQVYSLAHTKSISSYYHIILMSFFLLVAALVMSPSASMGLVMAGYLVTMTGCLLLVDRARNELTASAPTLTIVGERRISEHAVRSGRSSSLAMSSLLLVVLFGVTVALFVVMPRTEAGLLGTAVDTQVHTTGLSDSVSLELTGTLNNDSTAVMRVQFLEQPGGRYPEEMYWRATTMDKYSGTGWTRQGLSTRAGSRDVRSRGFQDVRSPFRVIDGATRARSGVGDDVRYEIFVDSYPEGGLPLLSTVYQVAPKEPSKDIKMYFERGGDFTVNINYRNAINPYFKAVSNVIRSTPEELRSSSEDYLELMVPSDLRLLTEQDLEERTLDLTRRITQGASTVYDRVALIEAYLSGARYEYTKDIPELSATHPIDSFIHDVRFGHCELYASAMALMVRSLGVPARVVSGYRGGDWAENDQSYTVTNNMAHLWVEVFFPDYGWVTFDPAPAVDDVELTAFEAFQNAWAKYSLRARIIWLQNVVGFSPNESYVFLRDRSLEMVTNLFASTKEDGTIQKKVTIFERLQGLLFVLFLCALSGSITLFMVRLIRGAKAVPRYLLSDDQEQAKVLYLQLMQKLDSMQLGGHNRTAEEMLEGVRESSAALHEELLPFVSGYLDVRFGAHRWTAEEMTRFKMLIRDLKVSHST